jgi:hypothetical protein
MAVIYKTDGQRVGVEPKDPKQGFTLKELKAAIGGGYIEVVPLISSSGSSMGKLIVCDEDGRSKGLPFNEQASAVFGMYVHGGDFVGDILVCNVGEIQ